MSTESAASIFDHRLIIVTGKGGTGKTTIAASLALAGCTRGLRTIAIELGHRENLPRLLASDPPEVGYKGVELRPGLTAMHIDPFEALAEYLGMQLGVQAPVDLVVKNGAFQQFLQGAPGWRELITLGKIWQLEQLTETDGTPTYDLIVVDAPATGHGLTFLDVPRVVASAVRKGPLQRNAEAVEALIRDPVRTLLLPVTLPEELPARETVELVTRLESELGIEVDRVVVNGVAPSPFPLSCPNLDEHLRRISSNASSFEGLPDLQTLADCAGLLESRYTLNRHYTREIADRTKLPVVALPYLDGGVRGPSDIEFLSRWFQETPDVDGHRATGADLQQMRPQPDPPGRQHTGEEDGVAVAPGTRRTPSRPSKHSLDQLLRDQRLVVCVGTGGVGKTTIASSLALRAARSGRRTLVMTVDPARRLADALGLAELGSEPRRVPAERLRALGAADAELSAMMLDMKRTFDELVTRVIEDGPKREQILDNPIYQHLSTTLAGSAEYAAMAKVYEMSQSDEFDLIVVDTPPSQHVLDFLEAPQRIIDFLDSRIVKILLTPAVAAGRLSFRLFHRATERVLSLMERITGLSFLEDISEFLLMFADMGDRFRTGAYDIHKLVTGDDAGFVLVAGATPEAATTAGEFLTHLEESGIPVRVVVVNRARHWPGDLELDARPVAGSENDRKQLVQLYAASGLTESLADEAADATLQLADRYAHLVQTDAASTRGLREQSQRNQLCYRSVPEFAQDVYDLQGLTRLDRFLFDTEL